MENAADALHMAFAIFVFVIAISLAFTTFSSAREVTDMVLYMNDKTNFEDYVKVASSNRIVGLETIVPEIRRYIVNNEGYSIEFIDKLGGSDFKLTFDLKKQMNDLDGIDEIITEPSELKEYLKRCLETITAKYKYNKDVQFEEKYSETVHKGGTIVVGDDGETLEKVNTETNVKITYTRIK